MKIQTLNQKGEKGKDVVLPKEIFEAEVKPNLIAQVVSIQMSNRRRKIAAAKGRGEVRGGGKKPWRQKGTGRARHGSIRSPIWRGGGVSFGPDSERNFKKNLSQKMKRKALLGVLSKKAEDKEIIVLENLKIEKPKTKLMKEVLDKLGLKGSILIATPQKDDLIFKSARNIAGVRIISARELNVLDIVSSKYLLLLKESIKVIKETFLK